MAIGKHITVLVLALVLHHSAAAWADEDDPCTNPLTPEPRQEAPQIQEPPSSYGNQQFQFFDNFQPTLWEPFSIPGEGETLAELVDRLHGSISQRLLTTAVWLDSFFSDERAAAELNQSYIRVRYDTFKERRTPASYTPAVDLRLALPQLEKKAHVVFSAEPAETAKTSPAPVAAAATSDRIAAPEENKVTTALYYFIRSSLRESIIVRTGALFRHGTPVLFISPRYRKFTSLQVWDFRFTQDAIWRTDTRWQVNTRFDLERLLPYDLFFRTSAGGTWMEIKKGYFYSIGCSLRQPFDQKRALEYEWLSSFQTRPVGELVEVMFRVRYRQSFWRDWMFFEVAPQYRLPRDRQFNGTPGILFRLEMFFGRKA